MQIAPSEESPDEERGRQPRWQQYYQMTHKRPTCIYDSQHQAKSTHFMIHGFPSPHTLEDDLCKSTDSASALYIFATELSPTKPKCYYFLLTRSSHLPSCSPSTSSNVSEMPHTRQLCLPSQTSWYSALQVQIHPRLKAQRHENRLPCLVRQSIPKVA